MSQILRIVDEFSLLPDIAGIVIFLKAPEQTRALSKIHNMLICLQKSATVYIKCTYVHTCYFSNTHLKNVF
jgi:hypothetical protein